MLGLSLRGYKRKQKLHRETILFRRFYGISPKTCVEVWHDLRHLVPSAIPAARKPKHLLVALNWMKDYTTQEKLGVDFNLSEKNLSEWCKTMAKGMQRLKPAKVCMRRNPMLVENVSVN